MISNKKKNITIFFMKFLEFFFFFFFLLNTIYGKIYGEKRITESLNK